MKRIILLIATNLAIMLLLGVVASLLGLGRSGGLGSLLAFCALMGFGGAFLSLLISRPMARWTTGARVIETPANETERWLLATVQRLSQRAGLPMPQVAIYEGEANAFATGAGRSRSMVAVSTGLLAGMREDEVEAVLAHEVAHIANGDMVTLTLIQGVVNTFVFFLARVVGSVIDRALSRDENDAPGHGIGYMVTVFVCEMVFGLLASLIVLYFSRQREFRADAGAARLLGSPRPMIAALERLSGHGGELPAGLAASGIAGKAGLSALFATHPDMASRIAALKSMNL